jgi:hypothetical protein
LLRPRLIGNFLSISSISAQQVRGQKQADFRGLDLGQACGDIVRHCVAFSSDRRQIEADHNDFDRDE